MFYIRFFILKNERFAHPLFLMSDVSELLRLLTKNERIAQVAHQKWANRSFFWANRSFANFLAKNEQFAQKTDEQIPSPAETSQSLWGRGGQRLFKEQLLSR